MLDIDPHAERVLHLVQQWVTKAEHDLQNAAHTLRLGDSGPLDTVCFHAQQCVEKYLKALLSLHEIDFYRTHDISALLALLPIHLRPELTPEEQARLGDYAVVMRYPGDYEPVSLAEAERAVKIARRVRTQVRQRLPKASTATPTAAL
jgi:HEPN domain-containing protein